MKTKSILLLLLMALLTACSAVAATTYRYGDVVQTVRGDAVGGATVTVYLANTTNLASLYSGVTDAYPAITNPTYTDSYGRYSFFVVEGNYDVVVSGPNVTTYTIEGVRVFGAAYDTPWFDVTDYGATGDGTTDDTAAIQAAIDAAVVAGSGDVLFPDGKYITSSSIVVDRGAAYEADRSSGITLDFGTSILEASDTATYPILLIGASGNRNMNVNVFGGTMQYASENWSANAACIKMLNAYNCRVYNSRVLFGKYGVLLEASAGLGCTYNLVEGLRATDCLNPFQLYRSDSTGFVNENTIIGGGCQYRSSTGDASTGYALSLLSDVESGNIINNNKFVGISLEQGKGSLAPACIYDQYGQYNSFDNLRLEGFSTPYYTAGASTQYEYMRGGYVTNKGDFASSADQLKIQIVTGREAYYHGGSSTEAALTLSNSSSSAYPALRVRNADNTSTEIDLRSDGIIELNDSSYIQSGANGPEGVRTAPEGSIFLRSNGGPGTSLYVKESGTGNTGWAAVSTSRSYGSMYQHDTGTVVTFGAASVDSVIGGWTTGLVSGFTFGAASRAIIPDETGVYLVNWGVSVTSSGTGKTYELSVSVNDVVEVSSSQDLTISATASDRTASGTAIVSVTAGQPIKLVARNETDTTSLTVDHANLTAYKIN